MSLTNDVKKKSWLAAFLSLFIDSIDEEVEFVCYNKWGIKISWVAKSSVGLSNPFPYLLPDGSFDIPIGNFLEIEGSKDGVTVTVSIEILLSSVMAFVKINSEFTLGLGVSQTVEANNTFMTISLVLQFSIKMWLLVLAIAALYALSLVPALAPFTATLGTSLTTIAANAAAALAPSTKAIVSAMRLVGRVVQMSI